MKHAAVLTPIIFSIAVIGCALSGAALAEEDPSRQDDFDLRSRQPIMSPPGVPIGPIMPARRQQHAIEETSTLHQSAPKPSFLDKIYSSLKKPKA